MEEVNVVDVKPQHVAGTSMHASIEKPRKVMKESAVISETFGPKLSVGVWWLT